MPNYIYHAGAVHNDNSQHITIEHVTKDMLLALVNHTTQPQASAPAEVREYADAQVIKEPAKPRKKKAKKASVPVSASYPTFRLDCMSESRLLALHDYLIQHGIIGNPFADFHPLFSGESNDCKVTLIGATQPALVELFRTMEQQRLIAVPDGFTLIGILKAHFVDLENKPLSSLDKSNEMNPKYQPMIDDCIRLMKGELLSSVSDSAAEHARYSRFDESNMRTRSNVKAEDAWDRFESGNYD